MKTTAEQEMQVIEEKIRSLDRRTLIVSLFGILSIAAAILREDVAAIPIKPLVEKQVTAQSPLTNHSLSTEKAAYAQCPIIEILAKKK